MRGEAQPSCGNHPKGGWFCNPKVCDRPCPMQLLWDLYK